MLFLTQHESDLLCLTQHDKFMSGTQHEKDLHTLLIT